MTETILIVIAVVVGVVIVGVMVGIASLRKLIYICPPNQVLIFSGKTTMVGDRGVGYRLIKGGRGFRVPLLERVDSLDLTNM
ncbi:MAG: flotillin family protein, partial [Myxococcales bacterium]|nr:flotillin family protein [Myxococcales bacterium]